MNVIEVKNLYKIFGSDCERAFELVEKEVSKEEILERTGCTVAINNVSFAVEKKEIFVVMGLSGSGKSTIIRCLNRLIEPSRGEVLVEGNDIMKLNKEQLREVRRKKMSMVFQNFGLFQHRKVIDNVEYGLEIAGVDKKTRQEKAQKALDLVGLKGYEQSLPSSLSGGMQQRVGLARALANDAEILLMDEAFSALDPLIRNQMQDELLDLQSKMHKTIVFITHDLDEALKLGDRIAILGPGGVLRQIGTSEEILTEPADDYVKSFVQNVDRTKVIQASTIMKKPQTIMITKEGPAAAIRKMEKVGLSTLFAVDADRKLMGIIKIDDAVKLQKAKKRDLTEAIDRDISVTNPTTPIYELFATAITNKYPIAVTDDENKLLGIVDRASIIAEMEETGETIPLSEAIEKIEANEENVPSLKDSEPAKDNKEEDKEQSAHKTKNENISGNSKEDKE